MAYVRCCGGQPVPLINFPWNGVPEFNQSVNYGPLSAHATGEIHTLNKCPKIGANLTLKYKSTGSGWYNMDVKLQYSLDGNTWTDFWIGNIANNTEYSINMTPLYGKSVYLRVYIADAGGYTCYYTLSTFTIE